MPLADALSRTLHRADASSFRLAGEGLWLVTGADLKRAADEWAQRLEGVEASLRAPLEQEHVELAKTAHAWLVEFNGSLEARLRGYAAIGRAFAWEFPWPAVAMLGVLQVKGGVRQSEALRLFGLAADALLEVGDWMQDVLRRTNRGIFADSVPCALWGLRAAALRREGHAPLAQALLDGPLPPAMDEESRALARGVDAALALHDGARRFRALAELTARQFDREQAVFTAQMGAHRDASAPHLPGGGGASSAERRSAPDWDAFKVRFTRMKKVDAPVIENGKLRTRPYVFPKDFEVRDHRMRSDHFGRAFVSSVTGSVRDFQIAAGAVLERWPPGAVPAFADGPAPLPTWQSVSAFCP